MPVLTDDMKRLLREQRLTYVATVCGDGSPNLSPKATMIAWDDDHLVFANIRSPQTVENLKANPAIEVNVVDPLSRLGYRFKGTAQVVSSGPIYEGALLHYNQNGLADYTIDAVVLIKVERALLVTSPAYDHGATEQGLRISFAAHYGAFFPAPQPADIFAGR